MGSSVSIGAISWSESGIRRNAPLSLRGNPAACIVVLRQSIDEHRAEA